MRRDRSLAQAFGWALGLLLLAVVVFAAALASMGGADCEYTVMGLRCVMPDGAVCLQGPSGTTTCSYPGRP